jgi:hypothetical protein
MGVNIFILHHTPVRLFVGGATQNVGSLRRFWKITEMDAARSDELDASEAAASAVSSLRAAILADVEEIPLGSEAGIKVRAHLVIGWDEGRTSVTDMGWDYLPVLGYAVRNPDDGTFVLHEERDGALYRLDRPRAVGLGLIGPDGRLAPHGQPVIAECRSVRPYIAGYAEADCTFDNGRREMLLIAVDPDTLPEPAWLAGKKPMQVTHYPPARPASSPSTVRNSPHA